MDRVGPGAPEGVSRLRTLDGLFVTDRDQRIVYWSESATKVLGIEPDEALGRPCYDLIVGIDYSGNPFCRDGCPIALNAAKGRPVRDYEVVTETAVGDRKLINNSILLWPYADGGHAVVHLFREVKARNSRRAAPASRRAPSRAAQDPARATPLSRREIEALRLAAAGLRTAEVASSLGVSFFTARNQLSSVMRKLNARNRVEAIARAAANGLL